MDRSDIRVRYVLGYRTFRVFCDSDHLLSKFRVGLRAKFAAAYAKHGPLSARNTPPSENAIEIQAIGRNPGAPDLPDWLLEMTYVVDLTPSVRDKINDELMGDLNGTLRAVGIQDIKIHFRAS